jgi:predicted dehydrogenase
MEIKIGIIGTGSHGSRYARHIVRDVADLRLTAISRRSPEGTRQAADWNCARYEDWRDLVADPEVEAVIAVVPPALNLDIAGLCAAMGKPLLIEKPLAVSSAAAAEIVSLFSAANLPLTCGQTLRFNPVVQGLRRELRSIGTLFSFSANQRLEPSSLAWHSMPSLAGAGVSFHTAVHIFDALRFITGLEVRRVMAVFRRQHEEILEDLLAVLVEMEDNVVGTVDCSKVGNARSGRFEFVGYDGQLHGEQVYNVLELIRGTEVKTLRTEGPENTIVSLLRSWSAFLSGRGANPVTGEDGLAAVRVCEACLESARTDSWVEVA